MVHPAALRRPLPAAEQHEPLRACAARILASSGFMRAPRMRRLLAFLVEQCLAGAAGNTSEYAIGIDVFDRDAASYSTCDDPIVRVQVGRLRDKLRHYYAGGGGGDALELSIPVGGYTLKIVARQCGGGAVRGQIALLRLQCLTPDGMACAFATGVDEELADCLYHTLGEQISTFKAAPQGAIALTTPAQPRPQMQRQLEGSIRADASRVRVALRLADTRSSRMLWSHQFDFAPDLSIGAQEHVAHRLAASLREYLHGTAQL